jgi:hypothetical protein
MITQTLILLALAIAEHEGWNPMEGGGVAKEEPTIAYRNHNPGNLRSSVFETGKRDGFAVFLNDQVGFAALVYDIWCKAQGKTVTKLNGDSTIAEFIAVWAPPHENDTENYVKFVEMRTGLPASTTLGQLLH